jgi:DegV family protein with EDD domain
MIHLVTDSTAYLPEATIREYGLHVVPLYVHFGEQAFKEGVELSQQEFYDRLKKAPQLPTTSQPSAGEFLQVFRELHEAGHEIVAVTISSKLSGTWNSAMAAQQMLPDAQISVVDSLSTSIGLYLMVMAAARTIRGGATRQQVVDEIERVRESVYVLFVVDTLEYLAKGGRIGNAKAFLGTMLKIKPILTLQDGAIEPLEQVRSKGKAVARMLDLIVNRAGTQGSQARVAITHALAPDQALEVRRQLAASLGCPEPFITELGPVIGTHTGPGVVAAAIHV